MRIGIDARFLTHPQRGGFKSYTTQIVTALSSLDTGDEYVLYTDRPSARPTSLPSNFRVTPVTAANALLREQIALPKRMQADGIEVAHFPCNTAPVAMGPRMVVTIHDAIALRPAHSSSRSPLKQRLLRDYWRAIIPRCARRAARVITDSGYTQRDISEQIGVPSARIRVVPLFVDQSMASGPVERPVLIGEDVPFIMAFASADGRKNHPAAIEAFLGLAEDSPDLRLALVCSTPEVRRSAGDPLHRGVIPIGPVSAWELRWLYRHASALLFPSFEEGFGLPPLEAMTAGTPVVASNTSSIPEIVGDAAILVDPSDARGMTEALGAILRDGERRKSMVDRGLERAALFTPERTARELVETYAEAAQAA